jgi:nitrite reductase/ring-hydroxylating ferredoxin subunit
VATYVVGPVAEFPAGTHRVVKAGRVEIGVFNVDGRFYAMPNVCTHQFGPLCEGTVDGTMMATAESGWRIEWVREGEIVTCPWHGLEFDIITGRCLASAKVRLRQYQVTIDDGQVVVTV